MLVKDHIAGLQEAWFLVNQLVMGPGIRSSSPRARTPYPTLPFWRRTQLWPDHRTRIFPDERRRLSVLRIFSKGQHSLLGNKGRRVTNTASDGFTSHYLPMDRYLKQKKIAKAVDWLWCTPKTYAQNVWRCCNGIGHRRADSLKTSDVD